MVRLSVFIKPGEMGEMGEMVSLFGLRVSGGCQATRLHEAAAAMWSLSSFDAFTLSSLLSSRPSFSRSGSQGGWL